MIRGTCAALLAIALVSVPALARAQQPAPAGEVTAKDIGTLDGRFSVNGTDATTLAVTAGATVRFDYPSGASFHDVDFDGAQPASCTQTAGQNLGAVPPLPAHPGPPGWEGTCTFAAAGTYTFHCDLHPGMTGTIVVSAPGGPTPTPTPTPVATPIATPTPTPTPTPVATPVQTTLRGAVRLARHQRGTRVRGRVRVKTPGSRLEVTLRARLSRGRHHHKRVRVGRWRRTPDHAGRVAFSVRLTARARRALHRHRLHVTVTVALTPPGGETIKRRFHTTVRRHHRRR